MDKLGNITLYNDDCMNLLREFPNRSFDLAIVDPPYFDAPDKLGYYGTTKSSIGVKQPAYEAKALYKWLLLNYAEPGDKILDTHLGSGSICIACDDLGFEMTGIELDKDYYEGAKRRLQWHQAQHKLF